MRADDAFRMAYRALQEQARAEHPEPTPGQIVTRDMCPCGRTTGVGATDKCVALKWLKHLENTIRWTDYDEV